VENRNIESVRGEVLIQSTNLREEVVAVDEKSKQDILA
jgi:hypothetical protein